jgi:hypothetical protein
MSQIDPGYSYSSNKGTPSQTLNKGSESAPLFNISRAVTLTGTMTNLPSEACQELTLINSSGTSLFFNVNSGSVITLPNNANYPINSVSNANLVSVSGSGILGYVISK